MGGHKFVFFVRNIDPVSCFSVLIKSANVTANGSLDSAKRTPQKVGEMSSMQSYERRVLIFQSGRYFGCDDRPGDLDRVVIRRVDGL